MRSKFSFIYVNKRDVPKCKFTLKNSGLNLLAVFGFSFCGGFKDDFRLNSL